MFVKLFYTILIRYDPDKFFLLGFKYVLIKFRIRICESWLGSKRDPRARHFEPRVAWFCILVLICIPSRVATYTTLRGPTLGIKLTPETQGCGSEMDPDPSLE